MSGFETFRRRQRRDDDYRHGTSAGAARHAAAGELPCDACRAAKAKYDRRWRAAGKQTQKNRLHAKAQARAERDLRRAHPDEYRELYVRYRDELLAELEKSTE